MKVSEILSLHEAEYNKKWPKRMTTIDDAIYGKHRKGSVAWHNAQRQKQLDVRTPAIEPKNQMIGTARIGITNEAESDELNIGDPVKVTGGSTRFDGEVGIIDSFDSTKSFAVVNLANHGKHSFHISNISFEENPPDEDDYQEDEERL